MKSIHLTDEILQDYLLKEVSDNEMVNHLNECSICQQKLDAYRFLIKGIQETTIEAFPFNVSTLAMNTVMLYEKKRKLKQELFLWSLLILLCMVIIVVAIPYISQILALFTGKFNSTMLLVIGTGFFVLLFLLIDILRQLKMKENEIFKNHLQPIL